MPKLICLEITTDDEVYNRTIYSDYIPTQNDLNMYYRDFCGLSDAVATLTCYDVPDDFNTTLLTFNEAQPTRYPNYDIASGVSNTEKRAKYTAYIKQIVDMEKSRAELRVHMHGQHGGESGSEKDTEDELKPSANETLKGAPGRYKVKQQNWVKDLLEQLESDEVVPGDELVPVESDTFIPHAWILTPVVAAVREGKGSRLLLDSVKGKHWENLLGTALFPDFIVSRRISTRSWAFQHETSESLCQAMMAYYLASQDCAVTGGLSDWIPMADKELGLLMAAYKKIKVAEHLLSRGTNPHGIFNLLATIESQCLASSVGDPKITPTSFMVFNKYLSYVCQALGIPREQYAGVEAVNSIVRRWVRTSLGFRGDAEPVVPGWVDIWRVVMRQNPSAERLALFLTTLDAWNPMEGHLMTLGTRQEIAREWVKIYVENELIIERTAEEPSILLYDETAKWCFKYLPQDAFKNSLRKETIGPAYTMMGFLKFRPGAYKVVRGVRFKKSPANPANQAAATATTADKDSDQGSVSTEKSIPSVYKDLKTPVVSEPKTRAKKEAKATRIIKAQQATEESGQSSVGINELIMNLGSI